MFMSFFGLSASLSVAVETPSFHKLVGRLLLFYQGLLLPLAASG